MLVWVVLSSVMLIDWHQATPPPKTALDVAKSESVLRPIEAVPGALML